MAIFISDAFEDGDAGARAARFLIGFSRRRGARLPTRRFHAAHAAAMGARLMRVITTPPGHRGLLLMLLRVS